MVVEFLTVTVDPADRAAWVDADERIWTAFLRDRPGFVSKQVWVDRSEPSQIHLVITWTDEASWKAIPSEELAAVDERMGDWRRPVVMRVHDVVR